MYHLLTELAIGDLFVVSLVSSMWCVCVIAHSACVLIHQGTTLYVRCKKMLVRLSILGCRLYVFIAFNPVLVSRKVL